MRVYQAILTGVVILAGPAGAVLPTTPSGLTCTAQSGAIIRLNIDPATREFQKEGFPKMPILDVGDRVVVLLRQSAGDIMITAALDRRSLVYTAQAYDRRARTTTRMQYLCVAGTPFLISNPD